MQYLLQKFDTPAKKAQFGKDLYALLPPTDSSETTFQTDIPAVTEKNMKDAARLQMHLAMFAFKEEASPKEPTHIKTSLSLAELYIQDTFLTATEPILTVSGNREKMHEMADTVKDIAPPWKNMDVDAMPMFSVALQKGAGRIRTAQVVASLFIDDGVDMSQVAPELWQSLRDVHCINLQFGTLREQTFANFKVSVRGSVRQAPSPISWVVMLLRLSKKGDNDTGNIIKLWNKDNIKSAHVTGGKAQAVKNCLELLDESTLQLVVDATSKYGWETGPFSEDTLASKKLYPGNHFRTINSKKWTNRQVVTKESCRLTFMRLIKRFGTAPVMFRHKLTKHKSEEVSEQTAVFWHLLEEAAADTPVTLATFEAKCAPKWVDADPKLDLEIMSALADKDECFHYKSITCIKELVEGHNATSTADIIMAEKTVEKESRMLEQATYEHAVKQMDFDQQAWRVWKSKMSNFEKAMWGKKMQHNVNRHNLSETAANEYIGQWARFCLYDKGEQAMASYNAFIKEVAARHSISPEHVVPVVVVNWVAPCTQTSAELAFQANFLAAVANDNPKAICPVLYPQFSYKKGQLYMSENMVATLMSDRGLNFDKKFALTFQDKPDQRDNRPLFYDGRVVLPAGQADAADYYWKDCGLLRGRTQMAAMLSSNQLQRIQGVGDAVLPSTTDHDGTIKGAHKYAQVGQDGMEKIVDCLLDGMSIDPRTAIVFVEVVMGWGNLFDSLVLKRQSWNFPSYYWSPTTDVTQHDWINHTKVKAAKDLHLEGTLSIPGYAVLSTELPEDTKDDPPEPPKMHKLATVLAKKAGCDKPEMALSMPDSIIKTWYNHPEFGTQFAAYLEKFTDEWGTPTPVAEDNASTPATKRKGTEDTPPSSGSKKQKVDSKHIITDMPSGTEILKYVLKVKAERGKEVSLIFRMLVGHCMGLTNEGTNEACLHAGVAIMGFGKGKFDIQPSTADNAPECHVFELKDMSDLVFHNNKLVTLASVVQEKQLTDPTCQIAFHSMTERATGDAGDFDVVKKNTIFFLPESKQEAGFSTAACTIPVSVWDTAESCQLVWATKWNCNGLNPVRPLILLTKDVVIPPGRTFLIREKTSGTV